MSKYDKNHSALTNKCERYGCQCGQSNGFPCACYRRGPTGPTGPAGTTAPIQLSGIQAELLNLAEREVGNFQRVVFDSVLSQVGTAISYNTTTGDFTLLQRGNYLVNWWVTIDGSEANIGLGFSVYVNGVSHSRGVAPPITSQVTGSALVTIDAAPATLSLRNISADSVTYENIAIQASIIIMAIPM